ncbi:pentatricopeptide repeat-containing protein [Canna indica]|uniref:Pentatricopeptide repeat-containing protein n=1 Tax=Canna indica TaxID=4628 RepID=A0AAQ3QD38_9LILI|nr:pentatricopeptide repeat-containing protein [Canna indica]
MVQNSLISAYGKCGKVEAAQKVFDSCFQVNRVTWNALISSYAQNGLLHESMQLLRNMKHSGCDFDVVTYSGIISSCSQRELSHEAMQVFEELLSVGLKPDVVAIASVLPATSGLHCSNYCREIHAYCFRHWLESDRRIQNAFVSVYSKFGLLQRAELVFMAILDRDVISWSSMVMGYTQNDYFVEALDTFQQMIRARTDPNTITITSVLSACAGISSMRQGKELHSWAVKNLVDNQSFVGSALVDMYAKCGRLRDARKVFDLMQDKNLVTYNAMMGGYAVHGLTDDALEIFFMVEEPDQVSFISALSACSHGGKVEEGIKIFGIMKDVKVNPREGHYALMVDLLARSGRLEEALNIIMTMPKKPSSEIWGAMLGACKIHSNLEIGIYTGNQIMELGSGNSGYYVLLSNILADFRRWEDVEMIRELMKEKEVKKGAGCSWIEVEKNVHSFVAKERAQHPEWESMSLVLNVLNEQMRGMSC